jgi:phage/plasmid-like protein (TIGR03299 family)
MAHELDFSKGINAFAFTGDRTSIWHGLGQEILATDDLNTIMQKAGLNFAARKAPVQYALADGTLRNFENQSVIYRDDTGAALGTVSDNRYNIVQPTEIMEFFRDFLAENKLSISTAGAVKGGRIVWCLAKLGKDLDFIMPGKDRIESYVRLQTSFDGTRATDLVATTTRQVCANTMRMCDIDADRAGYRTSHSAMFDAKNLQRAFGLLGEQHKITAKLWNALSERKVTDAEAAQFFCDVLDIDMAEVGKMNDKGKPVVPTRSVNNLKALLTAYKKGPGSDMKSAKDTAFGLLNAVTFYIDHEATALDMNGDGKHIARLASSQFGSGARVKERAQRLAAALTKDPALLAIAA